MAGDTKTILALGGLSAKSAAENLFDGDKIDTPRKIPDRGLYDTILSYHHLQTVPHRDLNDTLDKMRLRLKEDGEVHIFVPSLEWAARQILSPDPHPLWLIHVFGNQKHREQYHKNGFRLIDLRSTLEEYFAVTHATVGEYTVEHQGNNYAAEQFYLRGERK